MKLEHLKYFVEIVNYGSLNKAANNLYISQPAISAILKSIENELGFTLLKRSHNGVELTYEGEIFYKDALEILAKEEKWKKLSIKKNDDNISGDVHVSIIPSLYSGDFQQLIFNLKDQYPDVNLYIHEEYMHNIINSLKKKEATIAVSCYMKEEKDIQYAWAKKNNFVIKELFTDELYFFIAADNPLAQKEMLDKEDLYEMKFVSYASKNDALSYRLLGRYISPKNYYRMDNLNNMMQAVVDNNMVLLSSGYFSGNNQYVQEGKIKLKKLNGLEICLAHYIIYPCAEKITLAEEIICDRIIEFFQQRH